MSAVDYNFINQFDGNLNDDMGNYTWTVDSGTPSYVTGDNGQALVGNSAALSMSIPRELAGEARMIHFVFNLRFNTGYTNGVIFQMETNGKPMYQLRSTSSNLLSWTSYSPNGSNHATATETMTLDTWLCFGVNAWNSTSYRELEPNNTGLNYTQYHNDWKGAELGSDATLLIGQVGNASSHSAADLTVATGVDIDFIVFDNYNEDFFYSQPLDGGFDARTPSTFITNNGLVTDPLDLKFSDTGINPVLNLTDGELKLQGGGGGGGPVIKEFWS